MNNYGWIVPSLLGAMIAILGIFMTTTLVLNGRAMSSLKKEIIAAISQAIADAKLETITQMSTDKLETIDRIAESERRIISAVALSGQRPEGAVNNQEKFAAQPISAGKQE